VPVGRVESKNYFVYFGNNLPFPWISGRIISGHEPRENSEMKNPKVYITQIPHRRDPETNAFVPSVNTAPAAEHGEVIVMMPPRTSFHATADLVRQMKEHLKNYDYEAGDCLVAMGDPSVIAVASAILGKMHGRFVVLKWDRNVGRYLPSHVSV
jgi:hypothetical protein